MSAGVPLAVADLREAALQRRLHELLGEDPAPARRPEDILGYLPDYGMGQELFGEPPDYYCPDEELQAAECRLEHLVTWCDKGVLCVQQGRLKSLLIAMIVQGSHGNASKTGSLGHNRKRACLHLASTQHMALPLIPEGWFHLVMRSYANDKQKITNIVVVLALCCSHPTLPISAELTQQRCCDVTSLLGPCLLGPGGRLHNSNAAAERLAVASFPTIARNGLVLCPALVHDKECRRVTWARCQFVLDWSSADHQS